MLPYLIAGAIGYGIAKLFEDDKSPKYADGGLIAPNGKKSNLTPEQYELVRTPEFKAWFGDWENNPESASKVVDSNGEPLVVYHGTNAEFNTFDKSKIGQNHWQSKSDVYGGGFFFADKKNKAFRGKVKEVFLKIEKPLLNVFEDKYGYEVDIYHATDNFDLNSTSYFQRAKENRNNGIIIKTPRGSLYVAFEPNQIKLADGSNTTFDSNNPDIRYDLGGDIRKYYDKEKNKGATEIEYQNLIKYGLKYDEDWLEKLSPYEKSIWLKLQNLDFDNMSIDLPIKNIPIEDIIFSQSDVGVNIIEKNKHKIGLPICIKKEGNIYIISGNHRLFSQLIKDKKNNIKCYLKDFDENKYKQGGLIAPNGKPSNLTPEQYKLVRTPAFKKWFGDWENDPETASKVVDENGEPLALNHTTKKYEKFDKIKQETIYGVYEDEFDVDNFMQERGNYIFSTPKSSVNPIFLSRKGVYAFSDDVWQVKFFANIKNLFDTDNKKDLKKLQDYTIKTYSQYGNFNDMAEDLYGGGYETFEVDYLIGNKRNEYDNNGSIPALISEMGYGGYINKDENVLVLFDKNNLKLADGRNTTFDANNPDIRYAGGGRI